MAGLSKSVLVISIIFILLGIIIASITWSLYKKEGTSFKDFIRDIGIEVSGSFITFGVVFMVALFFITIGVGGTAAWIKFFRT